MSNQLPRAQAQLPGRLATSTSPWALAPARHISDGSTTGCQIAAQHPVRCIHRTPENDQDTIPETVGAPARRDSAVRSCTRTERGIRPERTFGRGATEIKNAQVPCGPVRALQTCVWMATASANTALRAPLRRIAPILPPHAQWPPRPFRAKSSPPRPARVTGGRNFPQRPRAAKPPVWPACSAWRAPLRERVSDGPRSD